MPVSGLIVTLSRSRAQADRALDWLRRDARFSLGDADGANRQRLPITLDTPNAHEDKACWQQMQDHPGIMFVDVACVFFDCDAGDDEPIEAGPTRPPRNPGAPDHHRPADHGRIPS